MRYFRRVGEPSYLYPFAKQHCQNWSLPVEKAAIPAACGVVAILGAVLWWFAPYLVSGLFQMVWRNLFGG